jgi:SAM-dependent methyltransferase
MCGNSLALAQEFATKHGIDRAVFAQMNLFRPGLRDGFFDFVISNGVLHHTHDARRAFARISRLARPAVMCWWGFTALTAVNCITPGAPCSASPA